MYTPFYTTAGSFSVLILWHKPLKTHKMKTQTDYRKIFARIEQRLLRIEEQLSQKLQVKLNWLETPDICQLLNISKRTLSHYRESGLIPYSKMGGKVYYRLSDVEDFLAVHLVSKNPAP